MVNPGILPAGGGEMGRLIRERDWSGTSLGPIESWPQSLKTAVRTILGSRYPMFVWWGAERINFYNDAYAPILGKRHPGALGRRAHEIWSDIWSIVGPEADCVMNEGCAVWNEQVLLVMERHGFPEETYFTYSYSPAPDDAGGIGGVFCACTEETRHVIGSRRLKTLRELGASAGADSHTPQGACSTAVRILAGHPHDLPFVIFYLMDQDGRLARRVGWTGLEADSPAAPEVIDLGAAEAAWPLRQARETSRPVVLEDLEQRFGRLANPVWSEPTRTAVILPIRQGEQGHPAGFIVAGISPLRPLDEEYMGFLSLLGDQVTGSIFRGFEFEQETRRAEMAEALRQSEERLLAVFQAVGEGIMIFDMAGEVVLANEAEARILGYSGVDELERKLPFFAQHYELLAANGEPLPLADWPIARVLRGESVVNQEYRCRRRDNNLQWHFSFSGEPVRNAEGEQILAVIITRDITESARAQLALHDSERRFRQLADAMPQLVWTADADGNPDYYNTRVSQYSGFERRPDGSWQWHPVLHPDDFERTSHVWSEAVRRREQYAIEHRVRMVDGSHRWHLSRAEPVTGEDGTIRWFGTATDIHDLKLAEEAVRHSEERYRLISKATNDIIWDWDLTTDRLSWSSAVLKHFGCLPSEMGESIDGWYSRIHAEDRERVVTGLHAAIDGGDETWHDEYRFLKSDGSYATFLDRGHISRDPQGRPLRMIGSMLDLTERRRAEEALRESESRLRELSQSLEQRVAERTAALEEQTGRLRRLAAELASAEHRERKRLAALLHDDLQQLLVASLMHVRMAGDRAGDGPAVPLMTKAAQLLDQSIDAARNLTRQLRPPVLYEDGLVAALGWLGSTFQERHSVRVIIDADEIRQPLDDDVKALLYECGRELLFNAVKHAGVDEVRVEVREEEHRLRLAVVDKGAGFDAEAVAGDLKGGGFGLFSIRERLTALGGLMTVESSEGLGSRIELEVPLTPVVLGEPAALPLAPVVRRRRSRAAAPADHRTRLLVVDDHAIVREGITNILSDDERIVVLGEARDGIEAIEAVERLRPEVVLMDVNMPRMNGVEATREISRRWPKTVIIGLSIQDDDATAQSMRQAGAAAFIPKSGDSENLLSTIISLGSRSQVSGGVRDSH